MGDRAPSTKTTLLASGWASGAVGIEFFNLGCWGLRLVQSALAGGSGRSQPMVFAYGLRVRLCRRPLFQLGPLRQDPLVGIPPQGHRQPPCEGNNAYPPHPLAAAAEAGHEPL